MAEEMSYTWEVSQVSAYAKEAGFPTDRKEACGSGKGKVVLAWGAGGN